MSDRHEMTTRTCRECGERKPYDDFPIKARHPDGRVKMRQYYCKPCKNARDHRAWTARRKATLDGPYRPPPHGSHTLPAVDVTPLREWLRRAFPDLQTTELALFLDMDDVHLGRILRGRQAQISLHVADRILVNADRPDLLARLYPLEDD